jgi:hypothetical protein
LKRYSLFLITFTFVLLTSQVMIFPILPVTQTSAKLEPRMSETPAVYSVPLPAAQDPVWFKTYGFQYRDNAYCVIEASGGGFVLSGYVDYGLGGQQDFFILRVDATGNQIWNSTFNTPQGSTAYRIVELSTGGYVAAGYVHNGPALRDHDTWVIHVDASGNHIWNQTFGRFSGRESCFDLIEVSTGGVLLASYTDMYGTPREYDMWLIRLDAAGNHLWNQTYGGTGDDFGHSVVETSGGDFVFLGHTDSFGAGRRDAWLVKTDSLGNHLWNMTYGGPLNDTAMLLTEVSGGGFAFCGNTFSYGAGLEDGWLVRVDAAGNHLWNQSYGGPEFESLNDLVEVSSGGFALVGHTRSYGAGNWDIWVVRTDAAGNLLWHQPYGGINYDLGYSIIELTTGGFMFCGATQAYGAGHYDIWLVNIPDPDIWWVTEPMNQIREFGMPLSYDTDASALTSIDDYWLNDTTTFAIDGTGLLTNTTPAAVDTHSLQLWVNDTSDNRINANITITIEAAAPPAWVQPPTDQSLELGQTFSYDLDATDRSGLDTWWINDTTTFTIDATGQISSILSLSLGAYGLQVSVNDTLGHVQTTSFTLTIEDTTDPQITTTQNTWAFTFGHTVTGVTITATDLAGIDHWTISDTTNFNFTVPSAGSISVTNNTVLAVGSYPLDITAYDSSGNFDIHSIIIIIEQPDPPPPIPGFPLAAVALGVLFSVGLVLVIRHKKRRIT